MTTGLHIGGVCIGNVYSEYPAHSSYPAYAGFWKRVAATLLDSLIVFVPLNLLLAILQSGGLSEGAAGTLNFFAGFLYKTLMESSPRQGTVGKIIVGLRVTGEYGGQISFMRAVGRYFATYVSAFILLIGYMMAGWTRKKQALHDMMASTLVVNN